MPPVDTRPEPKYGQYAPLPTAPLVQPTPVQPPPDYPPPVAQRPTLTRDIVVTTVLLLLGVFDVVTSFSTFANFGPELSKVYAQVGIDGTASAALAAPYGVAINVARAGLLAVTVVVSLVRIARHRRAFWVPLAGYLLSGVVTSVLVIIVMLNDPAYLAWMAQYQ